MSIFTRRKEAGVIAGDEVSSRRHSFLAFWLPWIILGAVAIALEVLWTWPAENLGRPQRLKGTCYLALATAVLLALWLLAFSGCRWRLRFAGLLLLAVVGGGAAYELKLTGRLLPLLGLHPRTRQDELLGAHRRQQAQEGPPTPIELAEERPGDFPEYRGRHRDGVVSGPPLTRDWKVQPPRLVWRQPVGAGYAAFAVAGNAAVTLEQRRDQEAVVCYDTATGRERWAYTYDAWFHESQGDGPRATPTLAGGEVFSLGATGKLVCLEASSGRFKWSVDILRDNSNLIWGMSGSPLVYDNLVVVNPGVQRGAAPGRALVAYDRVTGQEVWHAGGAQAGYSSPMLAALAGRRQVLLFDGEGLAGHDAATGEQLWRFPWATFQGVNVAQPLVLADDRVFISSGYGAGCALLKVSENAGQWSVAPLWQNTALHCKFTSPVAYEGFVYGLDEGILACVDLQSGSRKWKDGRYGHGQLLRLDDLLLVLGDAGQLVLVEASPKRHHELGQFPALAGKTWNNLALAEGKLFIRNSEEMACYDLRARP